MPDIFSGNPAPHDISFDSEQFLADHTTNVTDPIIETTLRYMRDQLLFDRIAVTGYCFGGRYAFRFLAEGRGADIGFAAHPSFLQDEEVSGISGPASIAAAGKWWRVSPEDPSLHDGPSSFPRLRVHAYAFQLCRDRPSVLACPPI